MFKVLLALFAVCFVLVSDALAICPVALFAPRTRVTVTHRYVGVAPMVAVQAAPLVSVPVVEASAAEIVAPAPPVTYYRQRTYYRAAPMVAAPVVSTDVAVGQTGAQRRHANKAARHAAKASEHAAKSAYWASRS